MGYRSVGRKRRSSIRVIAGVGGGIVGLALIFYGFGIGRQSTKDQTPDVPSSTAQPARKKPVRAWNMALGDVVVVAPEMGFTVKTDKEDSDVERSKFVARIESRLQNVRALYRQESEKDSALMGGILLQLNVGATGDVTQIKEIAARITNGEFKKAVLAEAATWSFEDLVTDSVTIMCPLLFVREGMDITTLVEWERSLGAVEAKVAAAAPATKNSKPVPEAKPAPTQNPKPMPVKPVNAVTERPVAPLADPAEAVYQIKYASSLRKAPNFSAAPITRLAVGTKVAIVNNRGEWLEIRTTDAGYAGFVRKEFITPADSARKR